MVRALTRPVSSRNLRAVLLAVLGAYAVISLLDWSTTAIALSSGGREGNPLAASLYWQHGSVGLLAFKALVVGVIIATLTLIPRRVMSMRVAIWAAMAFTLFTVVTVIGNFSALQHLTPSAPVHQVLPHGLRFS